MYILLLTEVLARGSIVCIIIYVYYYDGVSLVSSWCSCVAGLGMYGMAVVVILPSTVRQQPTTGTEK